MEMHIFGVLYTVLFVILCVMFIGTFSEKRDLSGKWCRYAVIGAMILADYFISVKLDGDIILKEIVILSILVDTFISKISFPMQPGPEIGSISDA